MEQIIGRKKEIELLTEYYHSGKAEFVAVYGRRRIGKTYLVRNLFRDKFAFDMSGSIEAPAEAQLSNFGFALREYGESKQSIPTNWTEAFEALKQLLKAKCKENDSLFLSMNYHAWIRRNLVFNRLLSTFGTDGQLTKVKSCLSFVAVPRRG